MNLHELYFNDLLNEKGLKLYIKKLQDRAEALEEKIIDLEHR